MKNTVAHADDKSNLRIEFLASMSKGSLLPASLGLGGFDLIASVHLHGYCMHMMYL